MTRAELTGKRSLGFSAWSREKLKDSREGLIWTDIDCLLHDYKLKTFMLVEVKTVHGHLRFPQSQLLKYLDDCMKNATISSGFEYWGFYVIRMSGERPDMSDKLYLNDTPITESDLIKHLNFEKKYQPLKLFE